MQIKSYKELQVWQKAIDLTVQIYHTTEKFPASELYGLSNQMRRAAVSVPSNIAEGWERGYRQEYIQFLRTSLGSVAELETQLPISQRLKYVNQKNSVIMENSLLEIKKMTYGIIRQLRKHSLTPSP